MNLPTSNLNPRVECPGCDTTYTLERLGLLPLRPFEVGASVVCAVCHTMFDLRLTPTDPEPDETDRIEESVEETSEAVAVHVGRVGRLALSIAKVPPPVETRVNVTRTVVKSAPRAPQPSHRVTTFRRPR